MLHQLDCKLERRGHRFARYADDLVILVKSQRTGERVMRSITRYLEDSLKLKVNPAKSKVAPMSECTFLLNRPLQTRKVGGMELGKRNL